MTAGLTAREPASLRMPSAPTAAALPALPSWTRMLVGVGGSLLVGGLAAANGGYFPTSWGWAGVTLAWVVAVALVLGAPLALSRLETLFVGGLAAFGGWIALSLLWTESVTSSALEAERALVYPLGVLAALVLTRRSSVRTLVGGVLAAITLVCAYALATKLLPERLGSSADAIVGQRLSHPLGYWNALGIFAALGMLLALGFAARAHARWARGTSAAALVLLAPTLYLTFSRGAWVALIVGVVVAIACDTRPLQLAMAFLVSSLAPAAVVFFAAHSDLVRLTNTATVGHDGHRIALLVVLLAVIAAIANAALVSLEDHVVLPERLRRAAAIALLAAALLAVLAGTARYGGPVTLVHKAVRAFAAPPPTVHGSLNHRLFNLSSSGRNVQYRAALDEFEAHPVLGSGAGTYERYWLKARPLGSWQIRDAHSLYIETLGELGLVGLAVLVAALAAPLAALRRARQHPLASCVAGAYAAYLVHAGFDWDWEMTSVTLAALLCGASLLRLGVRGETAPPLRARWRRVVLAIVIVAGVASTIGLVGNTATAKSARAVRTERWAQAERSARTARAWAPWSSAPLLWLGEAQVGRNDLVAARRNLRAAIAKDRSDWELWFDLALASPRGGRAQRHALAVALRLDPLSPEVREFMAGIGLSLAKVKGA